MTVSALLSKVAMAVFDVLPQVDLLGECPQVHAMLLNQDPIVMSLLLRAMKFFAMKFLALPSHTG